MVALTMRYMRIETGCIKPINICVISFNLLPINVQINGGSLPPLVAPLPYPNREAAHSPVKSMMACAMIKGHRRPFLANHSVKMVKNTMIPIRLNAP